MENFLATKAAHGFVVGQRYPVLRTIMGECVVIIKDERTPNVVLSESDLLRCGKLSGKPQLG